MTRGFHTACETPGCTNQRNLGQELCFACWQRLPRDRREALMAAQRSGRFHDRAQLGRDARVWLVEHAPAVSAGRRMGEAPG